MSTQQQSLITVTVDGDSLGTWDTRSGGESSAEITKHRPGGMGPEKSYSAIAGTGDVTVTRVFERGAVMEIAARLRPRVGRARMTVSEQPLDEDGLPWGRPTGWTGKLMSLNTGDADSNSNELRFLELGLSSEDVA